jgi:hypothetical protein
VRTTGITWHAIPLEPDAFAATKKLLTETFGVTPAVDMEGFLMAALPDGIMLELYAPQAVPKYGYNDGIAFGFRVEDVEAASAELAEEGLELLGEINRLPDLDYAYRLFGDRTGGSTGSTRASPSPAEALRRTEADAGGAPIPPRRLPRSYARPIAGGSAPRRPAACATGFRHRHGRRRASTAFTPQPADFAHPPPASLQASTPIPGLHHEDAGRADAGAAQPREALQRRGRRRLTLPTRQSCWRTIRASPPSRGPAAGPTTEDVSSAAPPQGG